ncbi:hypothetical protein B1F69_21190 [Pseudomonas syringae]|nr:hypothetical protein B1F69_21190 [Pseudomonas syringae]
MASVLRYIYGDNGSSEHLSLLMLQRGNAAEDAERPERHAHAEHGHDSVLRRACGKMDLQNTSRSSRSSVGMQQRTQSVQNGMPTRSMGTIVFPGTSEGAMDLPNTARSSRSSVGMQFTTLCVERRRRASRPACPRGAWARECSPARLRGRCSFSRTLRSAGHAWT